jgi:hypothetical protein
MFAVFCFCTLVSVQPLQGTCYLYRETCQLLKSYVSNVFIVKGHTRSCALFRGPHVGKPHHLYNRLNDGEIFIVHIKVITWLRATQYNLAGLGLEMQGLKNSVFQYQFLMGRDKEPSSRC